MSQIFFGLSSAVKIVSLHYHTLLGDADAFSNASTSAKPNKLSSTSSHIPRHPCVSPHCQTLLGDADALSNASTPAKPNELSSSHVPRHPFDSPCEVIKNILINRRYRIDSPTFSFIYHIFQCDVTWTNINEKLFNFLSNNYNKKSDAVLKEFCIKPFVNALMDYAHAFTTPALHKLALCLEVLDMICVMFRKYRVDYDCVEYHRNVIELTYKLPEYAPEEVNEVPPTLKNVLKLEESHVRIKVIYL